MFVWGGVDSTGSPLGDGGIFDPASNSWSPLPPAPISARQSARGWWTGDRIIIFGGVGVGCSSGCSDGAVLNFDATGPISWKKIPVMSGSIDQYWSPTTNELVLLNGVLSGEAINLSTLARRPVPGWPLPATKYLSSVQFRDSYLAVDYAGGDDCAKGGCPASSYDPKANVWSTPSASVIDSPIISLEGDGVGYFYQDYGVSYGVMTAFDPMSKTWSAFPKRVRVDPMMGWWAGHRFNIIGADRSLSSFDPTTSTWSGGPSVDLLFFGTKAVGINDQSIIWGGSIGSGATNSGRIYQP